jgi:hypothetical protein
MATPTATPGGKCQVALRAACGAAQQNATACTPCVETHASALKAGPATGRGVIQTPLSIRDQYPQRFSI